MLVKDKQIVIVIQSAQDEALIELAKDFQFLKVSFTKHLRQFIIADLDIVCVIIVFYLLVG